MRLPHLVAAAILFSSGLAFSQQPATGTDGIFTGSTNIGTPHKGSTIYNAVTGEYRLTGSGWDLWGTSDGFRLAWVHLSGDVTLTADIHFPAPSKQPLRKAVLMVRQSLDPDSAYADIAIHGDGHITLQYRRVAGGKTEDATLPEHGSTRLRIERKGNQYTVFAGEPGQTLAAAPPVTITLSDPVYVGIGVCPHNADGFEEADFSNVKIEQAPAAKQ